MYDNTLIVLSGDHGESLGEHGEKTHGFFIYNATLHVPFMIHLPGAASPRVVPELVSLADLMPTVLQTLKMEIPSQVQGRSLLPLIKAKPKDEEARSLYAETFLPRLHFNWSELRGVESANYHFIDAPRPELYDLTKDPGETQNLFADKKAVGEEMRARLARLIQQYSAGQELAEKTGLDPGVDGATEIARIRRVLGRRQPHHHRPRLARSQRPHPGVRVDFRRDRGKPAWRLS